MHGPDEFFDYVRVVIFLASLYSVFLLLIRKYRARQHGDDWNVKTRDYWFSLLMWSISGCVFAIQGIALDRPITPGSIVLFAAVLTTAKGVHKKGDWGNNAR